MKLITPFLLTLLPFFSFGQNLELEPSPHDLHFDKIPASWDEGIPLGNGMLGALIWQKDGKLRISFDRADLWDLRPMKEMYDSTFTWPWVIQKVKEKDYAPVQQMGDVPYEREPAPTKIPAGAIEFDIVDFGKVEHVHLYIHEAVCEIKWENGIRFLAFVSATDNYGGFFFSNLENFDRLPELIAPEYFDSSASNEANSVEGKGLKSLGYPKAVFSQFGGNQFFRQKGWGDFEYQGWMYPRYLPSQKVLSCSWGISLDFFKEIETLQEGGTIDDHINWWQNYWQKSAISLPDKTLEKQWYLEQYKFGCTARKDTPPISLQAIWTADNGKLPPWKGDFHHDLNTQLSYWPAYSANHLDLEEGFLNWLWDHRPAFERYTQRYFEAPGINVPGVTTLAGEPMGGWIQYSMSPTVSAWLGQHFYLHWRYSMDRDFLKNRAWPWLHDVAVFLEKITEKGQDGVRRLPISSSPEFHDNRLEAWFLENTNYDLALMRFAFEKAAELALELGKNDESKHWKTLLSELPAFSISADGSLMVAPGEPYAASHRHFSHLMAWHPLGLLDWSNPDDRRIIEATLADLEKYGANYWVGYSFAWLGNLYARARNGEKAAEALRTFARCFCLPNSFHCNGDQCGDVTEWHYRPFTLEGNFAFAAGVQEMLLQCHTGVIEVFPAIPSEWQNASFENLRAEGAFLVSAKKRKGETVEIKITAEKGGVVRLRNVFPGGIFKPAKETVFYEDGVVEMTLEVGETVILSTEKD